MSAPTAVVEPSVLAGVAPPEGGPPPNSGVGVVVPMGVGGEDGMMGVPPGPPPPPPTLQASQQQQQQQQQPPPPPPSAVHQPFHHSASLYVGDLAPDVNESLLYEIFNAVGPVASIRVCRDAVTRRSLGYSYINFHQIGDAERALDTMNYTMIKGRPCRIMWSQRDPSIRRSGVGNIFVKNLHESIDNKQLYDTFSLFGNILSCKVVTERETGRSMGYGYVHYETAEAASAAIEKLDGMLIDGQEVQVGHFMRKNDRPGIHAWTNCYVKGIPLDWDEDRLHSTFAIYGEVLNATIATGIPKPHHRLGRSSSTTTSSNDPQDDDDDDNAGTKENDGPDGGNNEDSDGVAAAAEDTTGGDKIDKEGAEKPTEGKEEADNAADAKGEETQMNGEDGKNMSTGKGEVSSLGYGFVNFMSHESALAAVEELNGKEFTYQGPDGEEITTEMFVGRAQKKAERERELRSKFESLKMERISKFQGVNLYVKNLEDAVTDDMLREEFSTMGTITSAKVMRDMADGRSRGFGFVCFSTPEEASRAVVELNGKIVAGKPIFVALAQRKEVRRAQLEGMRAAAGGPRAGGAAPLAYMNHHHMAAAAAARQPNYPGPPQAMGHPGAGGPPHHLQGHHGHHPPGQPLYPVMMGRGRGFVARAFGGGGNGGRGAPHRGRPGPRPQQGPPPHPTPPPPQGHSAQPPPPPPPQGGGGGPPNQPPPPPPGQGGHPPARSMPPHAHESLTPSALASASPEVQKNMIGERLYPLIHAVQPELAGKITGMLLEMDNSELLHLLESPEALNAKINEALQVLEAHNSGGGADGSGDQ